MNNSLPRLIDGMVATLRKEIIPHIEGEYARGQAFGVIYMLNSLKLRASWSNAFLNEQLRALADLGRELEPLAKQLPEATRLSAGAPTALPEAAALEAERDSGAQKLSDLIDWLAAEGRSLPPETRAATERAIDRYLSRQFRHELSTSAKPMFAEMSGGAEKN